MLGPDELDFQFSLLQVCRGYRSFPDGITTLKQTSMRLHQEIQRYIIGIVAGGIPQEALIAIRALADFRYRSQAPRLTDAGIAKLTASLQQFHDHKAALIEAGAQGSLDHWKIPKLEMMLSVVPTIPAMGAVGQWSADVTEHAHIDVVKDPARSSNNQNFDSQICCYLDRQEKCRLFTHATTIREPDPAENSDDSDAEDNRSESRKITDYFERADTLVAGKIPTAPCPYWTFALAMVAFHLSFRPTLTNMTVDHAQSYTNYPILNQQLRTIWIAAFLISLIPSEDDDSRRQIVSYRSAAYKFGIKCASSYAPAMISRHYYPPRVSMHPWRVRNGHLAATITLSYPATATRTGHAMAYLVRLSTYLLCDY